MRTASVLDMRCAELEEAPACEVCGEPSGEPSGYAFGDVGSGASSAARALLAWNGLVSTLSSMMLRVHATGVFPNSLSL